jgi:hypothetical protein
MKQLKFKDVYGVDFGVRGNITKYPDRTISEFDIIFTTPNHDESDVRFMFPMMAFIMNKNMILQILDGDQILYQSNRSLSMFVNDSGVDPKAGKPSGHKYITIKPRETWLKKNHTYTLRVVRPQGHDDRQPMAVVYQSLDVDVPEVETVDKTLEITIAGQRGVWVPDED